PFAFCIVIQFSRIVATPKVPCGITRDEITNLLRLFAPVNIYFDLNRRFCERLVHQIVSHSKTGATYTITWFMSMGKISLFLFLFFYRLSPVIYVN
ncbi:MAG: hypothetical protein KKE53_01250, partial [Proteobacteria bacterium]|nr:hypothetical protein [Pseudomonadota bacterium]